MPDGLQRITQADFSAGAFPGLEDTPDNGVGDIIDGFLRDDGAIERRGGTSYISALAGSGLGVALSDAFFPAVDARRTLLQRLDAGTGYGYVLADDDTLTPLATTVSGTVSRPTGRPVMVGGMLLLPVLSSTASHMKIGVYGGSPNIVTSVDGTATVTQGSATVTGTGSTFSAGGVAAGDLLYLQVFGADRAAVIKSVESNTSLTLYEPWPYPSASTEPYEVRAYKELNVGGVNVGTTQNVFLAAAGGRLLVGKGDLLRLSALNEFGPDDATRQQLSAWFENENQDYHRVPGGGAITGLEPHGEDVYVFSTEGVWTLTGVPFEIVDDFGNQQQILQQVSRDLILWHDDGLASWQGAVIVPAVDDLMLLGSTTRAITGGARKLYREYVAAGYQLGRAAVFRGHYLLPVLEPGPDGAQVDVMVWRLDALTDFGAPFVRWTGDAGGMRMFATSTGETTRSRLLGTGDARVADLSGCFDPAPADEDDHSLQVNGRSIMLSETQSYTLRKGRIRYEMQAPVGVVAWWEAAVATDPPGPASEPSATGFQTLFGVPGAERTTYTWTLAQKAQQTRMRFDTHGFPSKVVLRAMEFMVRPHGRQ